MWQTIEDMKTRKSTNNFLIWYKKMREDKITKERIIEQKNEKMWKMVSKVNIYLLIVFLFWSIMRKYTN